MIDDTLFDFEPPGRKIGELVWTCNCKTPTNPKGEQLFSKMYLTEVNKEGICIHCKHYALKMEKRVFEMPHQKGKYNEVRTYKK